MDPQETIRIGLVSVLLLMAVVTDIRSGRISNKLTLVFIGLSLLMSWMPGHTADGFSQTVKGLALGGGLLLPFYMLRLMGAGDVKLIAAVGSFMGPADVAWLVLVCLVCSGVLSVVLSLCWGISRQVVSNVRHALVGFVVLKSSGVPASEAMSVVQTGRRLPHAVAFALAWLVFLAGRQWEWGYW